MSTLMHPQIDIVMATYNGALYLEDQVRSIQNQTYPSWRLLVRDDGSTDGTLGLLTKISNLDPRIVVLNDDAGNLGFSENFLRLLKNTSADFIVFCDQDDVWMPDKLECFVSAAKPFSGDDVVLIHSDCEIVDKSLNRIKPHFVKSRGRVPGLRGILTANSVQGASSMISRGLRDLFFAHRTNLPFDFDLGLLAGLKGHRVFIEKPLMKYRLHPNNAIGFGATAPVRSQGLLQAWYSKRFHLKTIEMSFGINPQLTDLVEQFKGDFAPDVWSTIEDYLYMTDSAKPWLSRLVRFYRKRWALYRPIDRLLAPLYLLRPHS